MLFWWYSWWKAMQIWVTMLVRIKAEITAFFLKAARFLAL